MSRPFTIVGVFISTFNTFVLCPGNRDVYVGVARENDKVETGENLKLKM